MLKLGPRGCKMLEDFEKLQHAIQKLQGTKWYHNQKPSARANSKTKLITKRRALIKRMDKYLAGQGSKGTQSPGDHKFDTECVNLKADSDCPPT